ncbi:MAG: deoxyribonuclease HsdR [Crocinitomicaceae bacterium]|nr:deoxyribonuclease HsdR [Crocinitomicaceae bacterium]|tara:strand:+ start:139 stop:1635 length:1497 start_codon:yes stop_codon:yes gene_type:complete
MKNKLSLTLSAFLGATISILFSHFFFNNTSKIINKSEVQDIQQNIQVKEINEEDFKVVNSNLNTIVPKEMDFTKAAEKTVNSVVHIISEYSQTYNSDPLMDFFWGPGGSRGLRSQIATGSGVIISEDGYIVTNNHVIDDADKISITLNDGRELNANLIGTDPSTDLALLKIDENNLPFTSFGNSDDVHLGDWVLAVGNPFNLTSTVTAGIVSAKARNINILKGNSNENIFPLESFIQTDAAVNPGNSGGALVDPEGKLIGINTAIASKTGSYSGYSFAIPSNIALKVVNDLKNYGMVQRAFIGVVIQDVTQDVMNELKLADTKGVLVAGLASGGAAVDAGIKVNDIILKVENTEVNDVPELQEQIGKFKPGDIVNLIISRDGENQLISVELRNESGNTDIINKHQLEKESIVHGALFIDVDDKTKEKLRLNFGVKIQSLENGKFKDAGLKTGFIITHIDKRPVSSKKQLINFLKYKKGGILIEGVYTDGTKGYFGFGL